MRNISPDVDGWKAVCRFSNAAGKSYTTAAVIHVGATLSPEVLAEFNTTDSIRITVQPKSDPAYTGEHLNIFSEAEPITSVKWYLISQNGDKKIAISSAECSTYFPGVWIASTDNLCFLYEVKTSLNGWFLVAVFENANGKKASDPVYLTISDGQAPASNHLTPADITGTSLSTEAKQGMIDALERVRGCHMPGTAGCGYSWAFTTFGVADYFAESGINAADVRSIVSQYFQRLSAQERGEYRLKSYIISTNCSNLYSADYLRMFYFGSYDTQEGKCYYPWDQRDYSECFASLYYT